MPWPLIAAITFAISAALPRSAAEAVRASVETPKEICARSGTDVTLPSPETTIERCAAVAVEAPETPATRTTAANPRAASIFTLPYIRRRADVCHTVTLQAAAVAVLCPGRYRFQVVGSSDGAASRMKSVGDGGRGDRRSVIDTSSGRRSPLRRLQGAQAVTTFSQPESPPRERARRGRASAGRRPCRSRRSSSRLGQRAPGGRSFASPAVGRGRTGRAGSRVVGQTCRWRSAKASRAPRAPPPSP